MNIEEYFRIWGTYELVDGLYNVEGSVKLIKKVDKLPVKFGTISGGFSCYNNNLKTLEGFPISIGGNFNCSMNKLTSLEVCPISIGGGFSCSKNNLTSLKGCPSSIGGDFFCSKNNLTSLKGCPSSIGGDFSCDDNLKNTKEYKQFKILEKLRE